ncbi:hypothetical protein ABIA33_005430 [Streptacidiphilus sp. MAP12-16]|uniref:hypothetical protein n=1 Tax=Streptacidiphilus sp. MAP12-16 TaxID=3156300 RepID=UPI0035153F25
MKHGTAVHRSTARPRVVATAPAGDTSRRTGRAGGLAVVGVLAAVLAVALSGCGIRDTAVPVDAGDAASRTACPPPPNATLSALERDESLLPTAPTTGPIGRVIWPPASAKAWDKAHALATHSSTPAPSATGPTAADGTLSCLHVSSSPTASTSATPAPTSTLTPTSAASNAASNAASTTASP